MFYLMRAILIVAALIIPGILAAQDISPVADNKAEQVETQPLLTADQILTELNAQIKEQYTGKLDSVTPDALVKIKHGEETTTLRLYGIDCPEIGQAFAEEARDELKKRYQGDTVAVYVLTVDSLNVPVALVFDENSHSISHSLAVDGLAWWDEHNASKDTVLRKLNAEAVLAERAVFSEITALAPWDYRSSHDLPNFTYSLEQQAATPVKPLHAAPEDAAPRTISAKGTMTESAPKVGARPKQAPSSGSPRLSLPNVPDAALKDVDLGGLMMKHQPRIAHDNNGNPLGLTANNVDSIPYASEYGFREGDIISSVNGIPIQSESQIFSLIPQFQNVKNFQVEVLRNGQRIRIPITIK